MADNSASLAAYAHRRHEESTARTVEALRRFEADGTAVTYAAVATAAGVSRAWLYTQPPLRDAIDDLRARTRATAVNVPVRQRTTDASLLRRLEHASRRNRELDSEVRVLRAQLAAAHGELRTCRARPPVR